jgi:hypothetical protein
MAAAPHRRVIKATVTVLIFWTLVSVAYGAWTNLPLMLYRVPEIPWRLGWIAIILLLSAGLALAVDAYKIFRVTMGLRPMEYRGASTTIGILPTPQAPARTNLSRKQQLRRLKTLLEKLSPETNDTRLNTEAVLTLAKANSPLSELFWAVFSILDASGLPASPVRGSHGDALLITHSLRVSAAMAKLWEGESTPIMPNDVVKPAQSRAYDLPTAIVAGLAHDIGKVRCFKRGPDGITVIGLHDMVGGRLLASLPEFWDIVNAQGQHDDYIQRLLTQSVRYYHHPNAYPGSGYKRSLIQTDGGIQALMAAIHGADLVAGSIEGRTNEVMADYLDEDELPERDLNEQVWETFLTLMSEESFINSKSPQRRIAYKQGRVLYLIENKLRTLICDQLSLTRVDYTSNNNGNPGKIIQIIASHLDEQGLIKKDFNGTICKKPEGAGFYLQIEGTNKEGDTSETVLKLPHYVVRITDDGPFAKYSGMEDYPSNVILKAPTWPQYFTKPNTAKPDGGDSTQEKALAEPPATPPTETATPTDQAAADSETETTGTEDTDDRDMPPDGGIDPYAHVDPEDEEKSTEDSDDEPEESPFGAPGEDRPTEPHTAPVEKESPAQTATPATPITKPKKPDVSPASRERTLRELQRVRDRANMPRETPQMIRREMDSPAIKSNKIIERVRYYWRTYPDILTLSPGRGTINLDEADRKAVLFALLWMDQARRDKAAMSGINATGDYQKMTLNELVEFPMRDGTANVAMNALKKLGAGQIAILELQTMLDLKNLPNGNLDLHNSTLSAPVKMTHPDLD